jgi:hypothetical protein
VPRLSFGRPRGGPAPAGSPTWRARRRAYRVRAGLRGRSLGVRVRVYAVERAFGWSLMAGKVPLAAGIGGSRRLALVVMAWRRPEYSSTGHATPAARRPSGVAVIVAAATSDPSPARCRTTLQAGDRYGRPNVTRRVLQFGPRRLVGRAPLSHGDVQRHSHRTGHQALTDGSSAAARCTSRSYRCQMPPTLRRAQPSAFSGRSARGTVTCLRVV